MSPSGGVALATASEQVTLRLFCLPYAGGSVRIFNQWERELPDAVEVCPLELPGRGLRGDEPPVGELEPLIADLMRPVMRSAGEPLAFLGYGYGALLAFEMASRLERVHRIRPQHVYVAAMNAPHQPNPMNSVLALSDEDIRQMLRYSTGDSENILDDDALLDQIIPILRADLAVITHYRYRAEAALSCPVTAFVGRDDPVISVESMRAWGACTAGAFACHAVPGGHFFLRTELEPFLRRLSAELQVCADFLRVAGGPEPGQDPTAS